MAKTTRLCEGPICSTPQPADAAPQRRYCSGACRQQAHRSRHGYGQPDRRERAWLSRRAGTADAASALHGTADTFRSLLWGPDTSSRPARRTGALTAAAIEVRALAETLLAPAVADDRATGPHVMKSNDDKVWSCWTPLASRRRAAHLGGQASTPPKVALASRRNRSCVGAVV